MNNLTYVTCKDYMNEDNMEYIHVQISLDDDCHNGICDWSITGHTSTGLAGCIHEEILEHYPEFKIFVDLHLSNHYGQPSYAVENGFYFLKTEGKESAKEYLRATPEEMEIIGEAGDQQHFKYLLFKSGIIDRWKRESLKAIKKLEELTGETWENPYKQDEEKFVVRMSDEERHEIEKKIDEGYYEPQKIKEREEAKIREKLNKWKSSLINRTNNKIKELKDNMELMCCILDFGLSDSNVIFYHHKNEVVFNWTTGDKISREDFDRFVESESHKFPNIKFTYHE